MHNLTRVQLQRVGVGHRCNSILFLPFFIRHRTTTTTPKERSKALIVDLDKDVDESCAADEDEIQSTSRSFAETLAKDSPSVESAANEISGMMKSALKIIDGEKEQEEEDDVEILSEENEIKEKETNIGVRQGKTKNIKKILDSA